MDKPKNIAQTTKKIIVIYHDDLDGFTGAWAAWKKLKDKADYVLVNYDEDISDGIFQLKDKEIYFIDCSLDSETMSELATKNKVILIDHHFSSKEKADLLPGSVFDDKHSASFLSWRYFHGGKKAPLIVSYVEDYDIWKFKLPHSKELTTMLNLYSFNFKTWDKLAKIFQDKNKKTELIKKGRAIIDYQKSLIGELSDKGQEVFFEGHGAIAVNSPVLSSEIGNHIYTQTGKIGIVWSYKGKNAPKIHVSLRGDGKINLSELAKKYGGGGHKAAAGFAIKGDINFPWQKKMKILAIETSCDETSVAIVEAKEGLKNPSFEILSNIVLSQVKIHAHWGGVVPMMAKREHQKNLIPILIKSLQKSKILKNSKSEARNSKQIQNSKFKIINKILEREPELLEHFLRFIPTIQTPKIDVIAVTVGPGLEPALWVGVNFAKALSLVWNKPTIAVNHMEGHLLASLLARSSNVKTQMSKPMEFPAIALLVSGGHTELVLIKKWGDYKIIGQTRDDAAGECFDKTARMLELPYPGGPQIAKQAENFKKYPLTFRMGGWTRREMEKEAFNIKLPRPMIDSKDYDFSFSGLKTAVLYMLRDMKERHVNIGDFTPMICNEIQQAIVDVLISKTIKSAKEFCAKSIILGGGVAANSELRAQMKKAVASKLAKTTALYLPPTKLTTDNAAMIAAAGYLRATRKEFTKPEKLAAQGNLEL